MADVLKGVRVGTASYCVGMAVSVVTRLTLGRLDSTLREQLSAGACFQVRSQSHLWSVGDPQQRHLEEGRTRESEDDDKKATVAQV
jgi:hypothetical protein